MALFSSFISSTVCAWRTSTEKEKNLNLIKIDICENFGKVQTIDSG